ncbi:anti-sigma factor [Nocardioides sp. zg-579]|uniref:Regulator of SigK n=1 Tax=Nocardioides marmotae TaxID=2663857 RepID=A0A6I3JEV9_9ACTN|nr:anti-sigma factor [Nocardioides marmotae]MCR6033038.1 anti-sigma factor [Gordonia jinghuaiqii]MTB96690.1 anti-sigma factor [Nocardioides marmotae]QKE03095.1 anti-sigma factor [Nocardioides marmotae]
MSDDIHALSGAYAVDALDDIERAQFERHLAGCEACREEVDGLRETAALLAETTMTTPSAELRDRVLAGIATVRPLPPVVPPHAPTGEGLPASPAPTTPSTRGPRRRWLTMVAAAAAVMAVGVGGTVVAQQPWSEDSSEAPRLSAVDRIKAADDVQTFRHRFPDGAEAVLYRSPSLNEAVVVTHDMGPAPDGKVYQAWLQHDDTMVSAGLMPEGPDNVVPLQGDPATADGFGITVEPAGGSVVPSKEKPVLLVEFT